MAGMVDALAENRGGRRLVGTDKPRPDERESPTISTNARSNESSDAGVDTDAAWAALLDRLLSEAAVLNVDVPA
jgi:hypothetical protein